MATLAIMGGKPEVMDKQREAWPVIGEEEIAAVNALLRSGIVSIRDGSGIIGQFERRVADYHGVQYALAHNSGTATLHAAYFALGVHRGDEVIVPTNTFLSTATAVLAAGGIPVFCDVDPLTLTADPADIERRISLRTKAIAIVHQWGNVARMDEILAIAQRHHLAIVEDCSHAHGGSYRGQKVGSMGDIGCFSLQANKVVVAGEGGIFITNVAEYFDRALVLGHFGRIDQATSERYRSYQTGLGYKYRPHPLAIAIADAQWSHLDMLNRRRKENYEYLMSGLATVPGITTIQTVGGAERGGYYGWRVIYQPDQVGGLPIERFVAALVAEGVWTYMEDFPLLHLERLFREGLTFDDGRYSGDGIVRRYSSGDLPQSEAVQGRLMALPTFTQPAYPILDRYISAFHKVSQQVNQLWALSTGQLSQAARKRHAGTANG